MWSAARLSYSGEQHCDYTTISKGKDKNNVKQNQWHKTLVMQQDTRLQNMLHVFRPTFMSQEKYFTVQDFGVRTTGQRHSYWSRHTSHFPTYIFEPRKRILYCQRPWCRDTTETVIVETYFTFSHLHLWAKKKDTLLSKTWVSGHNRGGYCRDTIRVPQFPFSRAEPSSDLFSRT